MLLYIKKLMSIKNYKKYIIINKNYPIIFIDVKKLN